VTDGKKDSDKSIGNDDKKEDESSAPTIPVMSNETQQTICKFIQLLTLFDSGNYLDSPKQYHS